MPDIIAKAEARLAEIDAEATELRAFIATYRKLEGVPNPTGESGGIKVNGMRPAEYARSKRGSTEAVVAATARILFAHGRPMTRFELVPAIEKEGLSIGGVDKPRNLGTILWRSKQFRSTGEGYWPDEGPDPEPGREPTEEELLG